MRAGVTELIASRSGNSGGRTEQNWGGGRGGGEGGGGEE